MVLSGGSGIGVDVGVVVAVIVAVCVEGLTAVGVYVGVCVSLSAGVSVQVGVTVSVAVGVKVALLTDPQAGTAMVSVSKVTTPPKANALPVHEVVVPAVIPASSMTVPMNVVLAPSVVAAPGVQNTSQSSAPPVNTTCELSVVVRAPVDLKI